MFDFETRFWITVGPALVSIAVGLAVGLAFSRPLVIVGGTFLAGAWAALAYATCTYFGYGVGDVPEYDPTAERAGDGSR